MRKHHKLHQSKRMNTGRKQRRIVRTEAFQRAWRRLSPQMQKTVQHKIDFLIANPRHPSLQIHRMKRASEQIWVCYVSGTYRLLYRWQDTTLLLCDVGNHRVVDHVRRKQTSVRGPRDRAHG